MYSRFSFGSHFRTHLDENVCSCYCSVTQLGSIFLFFVLCVFLLFCFHSGEGPKQWSRLRIGVICCLGFALLYGRDRMGLCYEIFTAASRIIVLGLFSLATSVFMCEGCWLRVSGYWRPVFYHLCMWRPDISLSWGINVVTY